MIGVAQGNQRRRYAPLRGQLLRGSGENQERFAAFLLENVDVTPTHLLPDSSAKRFRDCFLSRKSRSQMARRKFHRHRIFNFALGKNAAEKFFAEAIERMLNARELHQIDADAEHTHVPGARPISQITSGIAKLDRSTRSTFFGITN